MEKTCTVCGVSKDTDFFSKKKRKDKVYVGSWCKECSAANARARYRANGKEHQRAQSAKWRAANPERAREHQRKHRESNPGYYRKYRDTLQGRALHLWGSARTNARSKVLDFSITREAIEAALIAGHCQETGLPFSFERPKSGNKRNPRAPSLDRVDPRLGYTLENVRVVVWQYNAAKSEFDREDLDELVEALHRARTISRQAPRGEASTTIPKGSRAKRPEVHSTQTG